MPEYSDVQKLHETQEGLRTMAERPIVRFTVSAKGDKLDMISHVMSV